MNDQPAHFVYISMHSHKANACCLHDLGRACGALERPTTSRQGTDTSAAPWNSAFRGMPRLSLHVACQNHAELVHLLTPCAQMHSVSFI